MRVVKDNGEPCDFAAALVRAFLRCIDGLFFGGPAYFSMREPLFQRLGDKAAKTIVVDSKEPIVQGPRPWWRFLAAMGLWLTVSSVAVLVVLTGGIRLGRVVVDGPTSPAGAHVAIASSPTVTATMTEAPPSGWMQYRSPDLGFSVYIPEGWEVSANPSLEGSSAVGVWFAAPAEEKGPDASALLVTRLPIPADAGGMPLSFTRLKQEAEAWLKQPGVAPLEAMKDTAVDGYPAAQVAYKWETEDSSGTGQGYLTLASTGLWRYAVQANGLASQSAAVENMYREFVDGFRFEEVAGPTASPQPPATSTPQPTATSPSTALAVYVQVDALNVREGPGTDTKPVGSVKKGDKLTVLGQNAAGNWLQVRTPNGKTGWVAAKHVGASAPSP